MLGGQTSLGSSKRIPFFTYIGRTISLNKGSFFVNKSEPKMHEVPPMIKVLGAPTLLAMKPADKLPKGVIPLIAIA